MEPELDLGDVSIFKVVVGPIANNVFIVRCNLSGEAVLVDAANEHERLLELCRTLNVQRVIETHGHWDHIAAVAEVRDAGYEVAVSALDATRLPSYDTVIEDGDLISFGQQSLRVLATPGHTEGSLCFELSGHPVLFSGDTLFPGGPGATSFEGGDFSAIIDSIENKLFSKLSFDTLVLPGHGQSTTIGAESPHLPEWIARGW